MHIMEDVWLLPYFETKIGFKFMLRIFEIFTGA